MNPLKKLLLILGLSQGLWKNYLHLDGIPLVFQPMKSSLFFILTFLFGITAHAQNHTSSDLQLNMKSFQLSEVNHVSIQGIPYTRLSYQVKPESASAKGFRPEPIFLALNAIAIPVSLYQTFAWTAADRTSPNWLLAHDRMNHVFAGFFIGDVTNLALQLLIPENAPHRRMIATLSGLGAATVVGVAKEIFFSHGLSTPDPKDALATALGGGIGTLAMSFDLKKVFRPNSLSQEKSKDNPHVKF